MAFISEQKRESLIKKINKSYGFRKFLMVFEMILLIGFIVMTFVSLAQEWAWLDKSTSKLTTLGIGMLVWANFMAILGIITMVLILTLKSPKTITKEVSHLESSARGGRKQSKSSAAAYKDRTKSRKDK